MEHVNKVKAKVTEALQGAPVEFEFEKQITPQKRKDDCARILKRYPERVPVICEKAPRAGAGVPQINSKKFLVPKQMTVSQLIVVVKNQLENEGHPGYNPNTSLYFTLRNRTAVGQGTVLETAHQKHASEDGFLYMHYSEETAFG